METKQINNIQKFSPAKAKFTCTFCESSFVQERRYIDHRCKQMIRDDELRTTHGQISLHYYQYWNRMQKRSPPSAEAFLTSRFFRTFMEFTKFSKSVDLPTPDKFIWLMVQRGFTPAMWRTDDVYALYIEFLEHNVTPEEQATLSAATLLSYIDMHNIPPSTVFDHMGVSHVIQLLRSRKLSPWYVLFSSKFKHLIDNTATQEQKIIIHNLLRPDTWGKKKQEHILVIPKIKLLVAELEI